MKDDDTDKRHKINSCRYFIRNYEKPNTKKVEDYCTVLNKKCPFVYDKMAQKKCTYYVARDGVGVNLVGW